MMDIHAPHAHRTGFLTSPYQRLPWTGGASHPSPASFSLLHCTVCLLPCGLLIFLSQGVRLCSHGLLVLSLASVLCSPGWGVRAPGEAGLWVTAVAPNPLPDFLRVRQEVAAAAAAAVRSPSGLEVHLPSSTAGQRRKQGLAQLREGTAPAGAPSFSDRYRAPVFLRPPYSLCLFLGWADSLLDSAVQVHSLPLHSLSATLLVHTPLPSLPHSPAGSECQAQC